MRRRSTGLMIAGIVLSTLGTGAMIGGGAFLEASRHTCDGLDRALARNEDSPAVLGVGGCAASGAVSYMAGLSMLIGGGSFLLAGIPMAVVGALPKPAGAASSASLQPAVTIGPTSASLRWTF